MKRENKIESTVNDLDKYSTLFTLCLDYIFQNHFRKIVGNARYIDNIVNTVNSCIDLGYWSSHFKKSTSIIIPKPNKPLYDTPKTFCPIILLNILGKLIEKAISSKLQIYSIALNFVYPNQIGGIKK